MNVIKYLMKMRAHSKIANNKGDTPKIITIKMQNFDRQSEAIMELLEPLIVTKSS